MPPLTTTVVPGSLSSTACCSVAHGASLEPAALSSPSGDTQNSCPAESPPSSEPLVTNAHVVVTASNRQTTVSSAIHRSLLWAEVIAKVADFR